MKKTMMILALGLQSFMFPAMHLWSLRYPNRPISESLVIDSDYTHRRIDVDNTFERFALSAPLKMLNQYFYPKVMNNAVQSIDVKTIQTLLQNLTPEERQLWFTSSPLAPTFAPPLIVAVDKGMLDIVKMLSQFREFDINQPFFGANRNTDALQTALDAKNFTIVNWLLRNGINISEELSIIIYDVKENVINLLLSGATKYNFKTEWRGAGAGYIRKLQGGNLTFPWGGTVLQECHIDSNMFNFAENLGQAIKTKNFTAPEMTAFLTVMKKDKSMEDDSIDIVKDVDSKELQFLDAFFTDDEKLNTQLAAEFGKMFYDSKELRVFAIDHFPEIYEQYLKDNGASAEQINSPVRYQR